MARKLMRWVTAGTALFVALALWSAYGQALTTLALDLWGPDFSYYDNGRTVTVKVHRLPGGRPDPDAQEGTVSPPAAIAPWPETALRAACAYTLNLMGLAGPEGDEWMASMAEQDLVVLATWAPIEVGRFRVMEGSEDSGLVVVELAAGPNGLHLMNLYQPEPGGAWFVVTVYTAIGVRPPSG